MNAKFGETSVRLFNELARMKGIAVEELRQTPKKDLRPELVDLGDKLCEAYGLDYLSSSLFDSGCDIVAGIRKPAELALLRSKYRVIAVWMLRPDAPHEPDNTSLSIADCDYIIQNRLGISWLMHEALQLVRYVKLLTKETI